MERHFKYFGFGLVSSICGAISLLCIDSGINMIINLHIYAGWGVVLAIILILWNLFCFWTINWCFGRISYFGHHMNHKIVNQATEKEIFDAAKHERFIWNCTCEKQPNEETKEDS